MVRGVQADEGSLESHVDSIFRKKSTVQVGLLIGRLAVSTKDFVLALVPTPPKDGDVMVDLQAAAAAASSKGSAAGAGGKKGKGRGGAGGSGGGGDYPALALDEDWIAEHARQVSRMLLGGLQVVGLYLFSSEGTCKSSMAALSQAVKAVADAAPICIPREDCQLSTPSLDRLLLHINSAPKRYTFRSCSLDGAFSASSWRPCEFKFGKLLGNFHTLECTYFVDIRLVVETPDEMKKGACLRKTVEQALANEEARLADSKALMGGHLVSPSKSLAGNTNENLHEVELLVPAMWQSDVDSPEGSGGDAAIGQVSVKGFVHARSYAFSRETLGRAVAYLKDDIIGSLRARLALLVDEAEQALEEEAGCSQSGSREDEEATPGTTHTKPLHPLLAGPGGSMVGLETAFYVAMPRRVLFLWREGISLCDYVMPTETLEEVAERCQAMLGLDVSMVGKNILEPEGTGSLEARPKVWTPHSSSIAQPGSAKDLKKDKAAVLNLGPESRNQSQPAQLGLLAIVLAIALTLVAVLLSLITHSNEVILL